MTFVQLIANGLITGLIYSIVALGFRLVYATTKVLHIAHGAVYLAAAYLFLAWNWALGGLNGELNATRIFAAGLLSIGTASLLGLLSEKLIYYPLYKRNAPNLVAFISSLGLYTVVVNALALCFGSEPKTAFMDIESTATFAGVIITRIQVIQFVLSSALVYLVIFLISSTLFGRNIRALSDNPILINVLGIDIKRLRVWAAIFGAILAAAGSLLRVFDVGFNLHIGLSVVLTAIVATIIGGDRSYAATVLAAASLGIIQNLVVWLLSSQWQDAAIFAVLVIFLLVNKEGLFFSKMRLEER
jgi:branched-chain amino acid transport system permease protein